MLAAHGVRKHGRTSLVPNWENNLEFVIRYKRHLLATTARAKGKAGHWCLSLHGPMDLNSDSDSDDGTVAAVDEPAAVAAATAAQKREQLEAGICNTALGGKRQRHSSNVPHRECEDAAAAATTALLALGRSESSPCRLPFFDSVRLKLAGAEPEGPERAAAAPPLPASEVGGGGDTGEEVEEKVEVVYGVEVDASTNDDGVVTGVVELPLPAGPTTIGDNASQGSSVALSGRKRGAASDALGSALDGGAWQLQQQRVDQQRVGRVVRSRPAQTIRFEAGAAPSPSVLHADARREQAAARSTQAA